MRKDEELDHIWFIADTHFLHEKIFEFFPARIQQALEDSIGKDFVNHDQWLINRINSKVGKKDTIYFLGDVSLGSKIKTEALLDTIDGRKILIAGNHDKNLLHSTRFQEIKQIKNFTFNSENIPNLHIVLCHYPISVWERKEHNSLHLHGHTHGRSSALHKEIVNNINSWDVGVDVNNYYPISLKEVLEKLKYKHIQKIKENELIKQINKNTPIKLNLVGKNGYGEFKDKFKFCEFTEKLDTKCFIEANNLKSESKKV